MQTFLPYSDFQKSVKVLDYRRLGKQRLEALQILEIISGRTPNSGWRNHPAVRMWKNNPDALAEYYNFCVKEWICRGYKNTMELQKIQYPVKYPSWLGKEEFHSAHRSNLLRKNKEFYGNFGWTESSDLVYIWPV